jgi:hypothetical protein
MDRRSNQVRYVVDISTEGCWAKIVFTKEKDAVAEAKKLAQEIPVDRGLGIELDDELRVQWHTNALFDRLPSTKP